MSEMSGQLNAFGLHGRYSKLVATTTRGSAPTLRVVTHLHKMPWTADTPQFHVTYLVSWRPDKRVEYKNLLDAVRLYNQLCGD